MKIKREEREKRAGKMIGRGVGREGIAENDRNRQREI
jgi:hypothetical protein